MQSHESNQQVKNATKGFELQMQIQEKIIKTNAKKKIKI
jgi:hypothetical protein